MTCGNVLGGQPLRKAIAGRGRLSRTGQLGWRATAVGEGFQGPAVQHRCSPGRTTSQADSGNAASAREARQTAPSWPNPARWSLRTQGNELRQRASRGQNAAKDVLGVRKLLT